MNRIERVINVWEEKWCSRSEGMNPTMQEELIEELNKVAIFKDEIKEGLLFDNGLVVMSPDKLTKDFVTKDVLRDKIKDKYECRFRPRAEGLNHCGVVDCDWCDNRIFWLKYLLESKNSQDFSPSHSGAGDASGERLPSPDKSGGEK